MLKLIEMAQKLKYRTIIARMSSVNELSIKVHKSFGFEMDSM